MATKAEVRDRAANDLGLLRLGQSLQSQDATRIESAYDEVYQDLVDQGVATWTSTGAIPTKVVPHVAALVADNCLNTYSVADSRYARIKASSANAFREIRRLVTAHYVSDPVRDF